MVLFERMIMKRVNMIIANTDTAATHFEREYLRKTGDVHFIWNGSTPRSASAQSRSRNGANSL
jgi:hypothetical protein